MVGVEVGIVCEVFAGGVLGDVVNLVGEIFLVADAVLVKTVLPDFSGILGSEREGEAAFDKLGSAFDGFFWGEDDVEMIRHDDEGVEEKFISLAVAGEGGNDKFSVLSFLEDAAALVGDGSEGVGAGDESHFWSWCGWKGRHTSGAKAPVLG